VQNAKLMQIFQIWMDFYYLLHKCRNHSECNFLPYADLKHSHLHFTPLLHPTKVVASSSVLVSKVEKAIVSVVASNFKRYKEDKRTEVEFIIDSE
jgi:hypothetical protein